MYRAGATHTHAHIYTAGRRRRGSAQRMCVGQREKRRGSVTRAAAGGGAARGELSRGMCAWVSSGRRWME